MKKQLHIGVVAADLQHVKRAASRAEITSYVDGDGWNAWGERPGTDVNDSITLHVVFDIDGDKADAVLASEMLLTAIHASGARLVVSDDDFKVIAVLSRMSDWSDVIKSWTGDGDTRTERIDGTHYIKRVW